VPYCENCGTTINPEAKFCGKCGAARQTSAQPAPTPAATSMPPQTAAIPQPPAQPQVPPQTSPAEPVLGVILLRKPKSLGRYDSFTAVVTAQRLIFAQMTSQMLADAAMQARAQAKAEGKGFMGQWQEQLKATFTYTQRYLTMEPSAVLSETSGNFAVDNGAIAEIKLHLKDINKGHQTHAHEFQIDIHSAQGTYEFRMEEHDELVNILKQVYGEKVKMPMGYLSSHGFRVKLF
jgi:hypothetical protein